MILSFDCIRNIQKNVHETWTYCQGSFLFHITILKILHPDKNMHRYCNGTITIKPPTKRDYPLSKSLTSIPSYPTKSLLARALPFCVCLVFKLIRHPAMAIQPISCIQQTQSVVFPSSTSTPPMLLQEPRADEVGICIATDWYKSSNPASSASADPPSIVVCLHCR